jgi:hypothetical protein
LRKQLRKRPRKEEEASGDWLNGLSQRVPSSCCPLPPSQPYRHPQGPATTPEAKCEALKTCFIPPIPAVDLSNVPDFQYPVEELSFSTISLEEIASTLSKAHSHKALGPDGLPIYFLKLLGKVHLEFL